MEPFNQKLTVFLTRLPASLWCYAIRDWKSRDFPWCTLWIYRFVKKEWYKILINFWRFRWKNCNSKAFVDIAAAGRHRGLSTIYIEHTLFHQMKRWAPEHAPCSYQVSPWYDASRYTQCTIGNKIECVFVPIFREFCYLWLVLKNKLFKSLGRVGCLGGWDFCVMQLDTFYPHQD